MAVPDITDELKNANYVVLDPRELTAILAGLRLLQSWMWADRDLGEFCHRCARVQEANTNGGELGGLSEKEIDKLCERLVVG